MMKTSRIGLLKALCLVLGYVVLAATMGCAPNKADRGSMPANETEAAPRGLSPEAKDTPPPAAAPRPDEEMKAEDKAAPAMEEAAEGEDINGSEEPKPGDAAEMKPEATKKADEAKRKKGGLRGKKAKDAPPVGKGMIEPVIHRQKDDKQDNVP